MKYKKIEANGYNLHMVKTDKFKTIYVKISLKEKLNKQAITKRNMLVNILPMATIYNPTRRTMEMASEDLYNVGYSMGNIFSGKYNVMDLRGSFLSEKYTEEGMNEKSLDFIFNILFHPLAHKNCFDERIFNLAKAKLTNDINSFKDNPKRLAMLRLSQLMDKSGPGSYNGFGYIEDLEKLNPKSLYSYYKKTLKENIVDIFIVGDIEFDKIKNTVEKLFKTKRNPVENCPHFVTYDKYRNRRRTVCEKSKFTQSTLLVGYKIEETSLFEKQYVSAILSYILGGSADSRLFKSVREENSLCYSIYSTVANVSSHMTICAGIRKETFKKAIKLIFKEVDSIKESNITDDEIAQAKLTYTNSLKELEDSPTAIINMYVAKEYVGFDLLEDRFDKINKVTREDIVNYANKLHLDTVYLLEGGSSDEENTSL